MLTLTNQTKYLLGTGISSLGDGIQVIGMSWLVYQATSNPLAIAGLIAATYVPALIFGPWAGVYADHQDAKRLSVRLDLFRTAVVLILMLLYSTHLFWLPLIYALQCCLATCNTLFKPASQTLIREVFADSKLVSIISQANSCNLVFGLIGSGLGGLLMAQASPIYSFIINAISFLVSALCNSALTRHDIRTVSPSQIQFRKELHEGWLYLKETEGMLYLLFLSVISSACLQMTNTVLLPLSKELGGGSQLFALLDVVFTVGGSFAGVCVSRFLMTWRHKIILVTMFGMCLFSLLVGLSRGTWLTVISLLGLGFFTMFHLVTMHSLIQVNSPKALLGRVVGLRSIVASATKISSALLAGWITNLIHTHTLFLLFGSLVFLSLLTARRLKTISIPSPSSSTSM
ncbi:MFS transporter [Brevibacillus ginsengisoli]|uniref:MFS transporter n=1 Tax=Brevibacillus ginsengisoli TaxID=363854 RepID=UPI003CF81C08